MNVLIVVFDVVNKQKTRVLHYYMLQRGISFVATIREIPENRNRGMYVWGVLHARKPQQITTQLLNVSAILVLRIDVSELPTGLLIVYVTLWNGVRVCCCRVRVAFIASHILIVEPARAQLSNGKPNNQSKHNYIYYICA